MHHVLDPTEHQSPDTVCSAEATDVDHPAHEYFQQRSRQVVALMRAGLELAAAQDLVRADLDLDTAARQCQAMMYGLQVQWLLDPSTDMVTIFRRFLDGLTCPARPA